MLEKIPPSKQITVEFANLSAWVVDFVALQVRSGTLAQAAVLRPRVYPAACRPRLPLPIAHRCARTPSA